jgi:hypothetical protein
VRASRRQQPAETSAPAPIEDEEPTASVPEDDNEPEVVDDVTPDTDDTDTGGDAEETE